MCKTLQSQRGKVLEVVVAIKKVISQKIIMLELCHLTKRPLPLSLMLNNACPKKGLKN
jgi:hypothetical protein